MIDNEKDLYVYDYLDANAAKEREQVLSEYIKDNSKIENMSFFDLEFYLKKESFSQKIEAAIYRSLFDEKLTLSESQIEILNILEDKNLFLSAPTSFGKTFIILEYMIRHPKLNNIVFIVPTLALMNELLKKIYDKFGNNYNICTSGGEILKDKNIFIFVPERSNLDFINLISPLGIDLLIIDEIYKLKPKNKKELNTDDRIILMNKVYLDLISIAKKIVLLGPFIKEIKFSHTKLDIVRYYTNFLPVYNVIYMRPEENWLKYMGDDKELIYFKSPESIYLSIERIIGNFEEQNEYIERYKEEIMHLEKIFSKEWYGIKLLKRGIGIHHGKIPMFLRKFYEEEYRKGTIKCLLCTSTLMEGINTPTMKMLIVDDPGSVFRLNNLIGRVGRLNVNNPSAGEIYLFNSKTCQNYENREKWETLTILAENPIVVSDDEVLFLDKEKKSEKEKVEYEEKIKRIESESQKDIKEIKRLDIRIKPAHAFIEENYKEKFLQAKSLRECISLSCRLLGKISYEFSLKKFDGLKYDGTYLPYLYFIEMLIKGKSYNQIIRYFEREGERLSIKNYNLLIDKLLQLRTYIKFKLTKIINYFELYNIDYNSNKNLKEFVLYLKKYGDLKTSEKIFEDLGIEETDFALLSFLMPNDDSVSTSEIIKCLKSNKKKIEELELSPFTKRNIRML